MEANGGEQEDGVVQGKSAADGTEEQTEPPAEEVATEEAKKD